MLIIAVGIHVDPSRIWLWLTLMASWGTYYLKNTGSRWGWDSRSGFES